MEVARILFDWILIVVSSYFLFRLYLKAIYGKNTSLACYVYLVLYIFCCLPILLDYLVGMPEYQYATWYQPFMAPMKDDVVSSLYDGVIGVACCMLYFYCMRFERQKHPAKKWGGFLFSNRVVMIVMILAPMIFIVVSGNAGHYLIYASVGTRGITSSVSTIVTALLLLSILSFCNLFFSKKDLVALDALYLILFTFYAAWISGKRYIIAVMGILYLFYFLRRNPSQRSRRALALLLPILAVVLVAFSGLYLVVVKPLSNTGASSIYDMLRVDFGRDDVVKYVIYHEFFLDDHILAYWGQSFLSTLLVWVPRDFWPEKPYQHYQYLTSSVFGLPISSLPSGITPCWFELCIANFSYFGIVISWVLLWAFVKLSDAIRTISTESIALTLIFVLLTQGIDAYVVFVGLLAVQGLASFAIRKKTAEPFGAGELAPEVPASFYVDRSGTKGKHGSKKIITYATGDVFAEDESFHLDDFDFPVKGQSDGGRKEER